MFPGAALSVMELLARTLICCIPSAGTDLARIAAYPGAEWPAAPAGAKDRGSAVVATRSSGTLSEMFARPLEVWFDELFVVDEGFEEVVPLVNGAASMTARRGNLAKSPQHSFPVWRCWRCCWRCRQARRTSAATGHGTVPASVERDRNSPWRVGYSRR